MYKSHDQLETYHDTLLLDLYILMHGLLVENIDFAARFETKFRTPRSKYLTAQ